MLGDMHRPSGFTHIHTNLRVSLFRSSEVCCCSVFSLFVLGSGRHVHAHPFEGLSLLAQRGVNLVVGLLDHGAHGTLHKLRLSVGSPGLANWAI